MKPISKLGLGVFLLCLFSLSAMAQGLRGTVRDAKTNQPMPGVTVVLVGTSAGTITNANGQYSFSSLADGKYTARYTFIGYQTQSVAVSAPSVADINLQPVTVIGDEVVVTGSRAPEKLLEAPASIESISADNLNKTGGGTFLSALANLKGVDFVNVGINGQGISARGFNSQFNTRMLAMTDGKLAQLPGTGLPQGNFLPTAPLDVKAIEVVIGPASALYGPNAHTGVVNVITKTPWDQSGVAVALRGGQQNLQDGTFRIAGTIKNQFGFKVNGQYMTATDFAPADNTVKSFYYNTTVYEGRMLENYDIKSLKYDGMLYYMTGSWMLQGGYGYSQNTGFGITNNGRNHIRDWEVKTWTAQVSHPNLYAHLTHTANDAGGTYALNTLATVAAAVAKANANFTPKDLDASRDAIKFIDRGALLDSDVQVRETFGTTRVVLGMQYRKLMPDTEGSLLDDKGDKRISIHETGVYGQLDAKLMNEKLRLVLAARLDNHSNYGQQISPKAALVFTPATGHNIRVGFNRAFKAPSVLETNFYYLITAAPGVIVNVLGAKDGFVVKNAAGQVVRTIDPIKPEGVNSLEAGYKGLFGGKLFVDVVGYKSWYTNFISPLTSIANPLTPGNPTFAFYGDGVTPVKAPNSVLNLVSTYFNFGEAEVAGLDAGLNFYATQNISLGLNYSKIKLQSFTKKTGEPDLLLNVPEDKLKGVLTLSNLGIKGWFASLSVRRTSAYAFESGYWSAKKFFPADGKVPARTVADLTLGYDLPKLGASFKVAVNNLTDDQNVDVLGAPIQGRFIWASVGYNFNGLRF